MTSTQGWIKMSERKPTKADLPFWVTTRYGVFLWEADTRDCDIFGLSYKTNNVTHWQPATLPEPPKKELTQRERDELSFTKWCPVMDKPLKEGRNLAWHAALAYRDGQNREDLSGKFPPSVSTVLSWGEVDAINNLKRRCGLDQ